MFWPDNEPFPEQGQIRPSHLSGVPVSGLGFFQWRWEVCSTHCAAASYSEHGESGSDHACMCSVGILRSPLSDFSPATWRLDLQKVQLPELEEKEGLPDLPAL